MLYIDKAWDHSLEVELKTPFELTIRDLKIWLRNKIDNAMKEKTFLIATLDPIEYDSISLNYLESEYNRALEKQQYNIAKEIASIGIHDIINKSVCKETQDKKTYWLELSKPKIYLAA